MDINRIERLKKQVTAPGVWPLIGDLGVEIVSLIEDMQSDLAVAENANKHFSAEIVRLQTERERTKTSLETVANALSYAESQVSEWRCKAGTLENELRRAELDKADLTLELEEARKDAAEVRREALLKAQKIVLCLSNHWPQEIPWTEENKAIMNSTLMNAAEAIEHERMTRQLFDMPVSAARKQQG